LEIFEEIQTCSTRSKNKRRIIIKHENKMAIIKICHNSKAEEQYCFIAIEKFFGTS
jgi:hypothetical protein